MYDMTYQRQAYEAKFKTLPDIISSWVAPYGGVAGKDMLDFGCGEATTAIGFARNYPARRVVGIDIMPDVHLCAPLAREMLGLDELPGNLSLHQIQPGLLHDPTETFDIIYSWSVFEHIEQRILPSVLAQLRLALRPGGLLFIQIAPLFYSSEGAHLNHLVPEPWGHLINQHSLYREKLRAACPDDASFNSHWATYTTLNRITAPALLKAVRAAGFNVLRDYTTREDLDIPTQLEGIFERDVLLTNQVVLLAQPAV